MKTFIIHILLGKPGGSISPVLQAQSGISRVTPSPPTSSVQELPGPTAQVMERYLNDSLHAWFRQEFLMEYQAEEGRLVCMVCSRLLPSLHLDHIKSHMLDLHPNSLLYSAEEKHSILQTWAKMHSEGERRNKTDKIREFKRVCVLNTHVCVLLYYKYNCLWLWSKNAIAFFNPGKTTYSLRFSLMFYMLL